MAQEPRQPDTAADELFNRVPHLSREFLRNSLRCFRVFQDGYILDRNRLDSFRREFTQQFAHVVTDLFSSRM